MATCAACYALISWLFALPSDEPVDRAGGLGPFLGPITGMVLASWWRRRRPGGRGRVEQHDAALRRGRSPEGADPAVGRQLLERALVGAGVLLLAAVA
ncbi:hypothetical protein SAMN05660209_00512 [Geodermatophilus africanus]|uniref:Uncharacterized protein n=1 Tax=Geodermatophilus africanus TaxID=1137993 RepID=A0A1H3BPM9_9ACTN|nr:hypothetical protein [Geodermatophilus africanus]SDX43658.1 hypothetical protein SAMN05660209_00512 [Geodermatophilus africanus]